MREKLKEAISGIKEGRPPKKEELKALISTKDEGIRAELMAMAQDNRRKHYGNKVYLRGLIEFSNYCMRNCKYCGIRGKNTNADRYRLRKDQIIECCQRGYALGYRTFVLQSGEDCHYDDETMVDIIDSIKTAFPDAAVTLSIGEKSEESYRAYYKAGVDRYL